MPITPASKLSARQTMIAAGAAQFDENLDFVLTRREIDAFEQDLIARPNKSDYDKQALAVITSLPRNQSFRLVTPEVALGFRAYTEKHHMPRCSSTVIHQAILEVDTLYGNGDGRLSRGEFVDWYAAYADDLTERWRAEDLSEEAASSFATSAFVLRFIDHGQP